MKFPLFFSFFISTLFAVFSSSIFPSLKLVYYAPFLVIAFFNLSFANTIWLACLAGLMVDLFSSAHAGLHALTTVICTLVFYRQRRFFKKAPINIAIFSSLISIFYTFIYAALLFLFESSIKITFIGAITDYLAFPLIDGFYALIFFALPLKGFELLKKIKVEDEE